MWRHAPHEFTASRCYAYAGPPLARAATREGPVNVLELCAGVGDPELGIRIAEPSAIFIDGIETHRISYNACVWRWHGPRGNEYDLAYDPAAFESPETRVLLRYC